MFLAGTQRLKSLDPGYKHAGMTVVWDINGMTVVWDINGMTVVWDIRR
jgi:hypothetical protein